MPRALLARQRRAQVLPRAWMRLRARQRRAQTLPRARPRHLTVGDAARHGRQAARDAYAKMPKLPADKLELSFFIDESVNAAGELFFFFCSDRACVARALAGGLNPHTDLAAGSTIT